MGLAGAERSACCAPAARTKVKIKKQTKRKMWTDLRHAGTYPSKGKCAARNRNTGDGETVNLAGLTGGQFPVSDLTTKRQVTIASELPTIRSVAANAEVGTVLRKHHR